MKQEKVKEAVNKHLKSCTIRETEQVKTEWKWDLKIICVLQSTPRKFTNPSDC